MEITKAQYIADPDTSKNMSIRATIGGKEMIVPLDPNNTQYQMIQKWVADGNTIQEAE
jgi:hypothetical protein|tara:strand:- start:200 stop:373 length:174 start_codon:yes stop_codon:yes gene_type:complete